jgi:hypothetical protein
MSEERKKSGATFWATVALIVVLVGYPLSFGPVMRLRCESMMPEWLNYAYCPLDTAWQNSPAPVWIGVYRYLELWILWPDYDLPPSEPAPPAPPAVP